MYVHVLPVPAYCTEECREDPIHSRRRLYPRGPPPPPTPPRLRERCLIINSRTPAGTLGPRGCYLPFAHGKKGARPTVWRPAPGARCPKLQLRKRCANPHRRKRTSRAGPATWQVLVAPVVAGRPDCAVSRSRQRGKIERGKENYLLLLALAARLFFFSFPRASAMTACDLPARPADPRTLVSSAPSR
ncbi:hypothetical protein GQ53DRAFT_328974 [Thozetella sp. PMI_491]|nr:hypothetical protein GQ53DRAFT_328974 [Thozetella sp. PMI_491]